MTALTRKFSNTIFTVYFDSKNQKAEGLIVTFFDEKGKFKGADKIPFKDCKHISDMIYLMGE